MLKIQVLGNGLIPRGYGLAPRKDPFLADLTLIGTILGTPGLNVNMIHPETNRPVPITNQNLKRTWEMYNNHDASKAKVNIVPQTQPSVPGDRIPAAINNGNNSNPHSVTNTQTGVKNDVTPPVINTIPPVVTPPAPVVSPVVEEEKKNVVPPQETSDEKKTTENSNGNHNDKPADPAKPGFSVKPINADDRKNNGK